MTNKLLLFIISFFALINLFWFWPGSLYFLNDDLLHIPLTDQGYLFQTNSVRPIHELLVRLDLFLWGKNAYGYHITALLLHLFVCVQLYDLCVLIQIKWLKIERQQAIRASLLAVVLFLAYPQSSEALAWIIGRTPVLSAVFFMITVRLFFNQKYNPPVYFTAAFFFAATLFTYEQSVLLPVALLIVAFTQKEKVNRNSMFTYIAVLFMVDLAYVIVRKLMTSEVVGAYEGGNLITLNWKALTENAFRLFFRMVLNPAYKTTFVYGAVLFIIIAGVTIYLFQKVHTNKKAVLFFTGIIVLLIAPVISLGTAVNSFESGRYLYLPSIFFIIGISIAGVAVCGKNNQFKMPLIVFAILLSAYWLWGKHTASVNYKAASNYVRSVEDKVQDHFVRSTDTLYIDTLRASVNRLPTFRLGFKTGINWFNSNIDTNRIVVRSYYDEVVQK